MYRLSSDSEEQQRQIKAIPRDNIPENPNTVVCVKHFPPDLLVLNKTYQRAQYQLLHLQSDQLRMRQVVQDLRYITR